jgi:hypothetical protein
VPIDKRDEPARVQEREGCHLHKEENAEYDNADEREHPSGVPHFVPPCPFHCQQENSLIHFSGSVNQTVGRLAKTSSQSVFTSEVGQCLAWRYFVLPALLDGLPR